MATTQELLTEGTCYICAGTSAVEAIELALLGRIASGGGGPVVPPGTKYLVTVNDYGPPAGAYVVVSAQLVDASNTPVATSGIVVTWSKTGAGGSFSSATSVTNASGIATVQFETGLVIGTVYTVTATDTLSRTGTTANITTVMVLDTFESYAAGPIAGLNGGTGWAGAWADPDALSALNVDWLDRAFQLAANPNATNNISATTVAVNDTYYAALVSAGIDSKITLACLFVPDGLIFSHTPLIKGTGSAVWTNVGAFVAGDLTVNGLKGNGTNYLNTGWAPNAVMTTGSAHGTIYVYTDDKTTGQNEFGANNAGNAFRMYAHYTDNNTYINAYNVNINAIITTGNLTGYLCNSRSTTTRLDCFFANSTNAHASAFNSTGLNAIAAPSVVLVVFATNENGAISNQSKKRISYCSFGPGLTAAESLAEYNIVQAARTSLGGGFV